MGTMVVIYHVIVGLIILCSFVGFFIIAGFLSRIDRNIQIQNQLVATAIQRSGLVRTPEEVVEDYYEDQEENGTPIIETPGMEEDNERFEETE